MITSGTHHFINRNERSSNNAYKSMLTPAQPPSIPSAVEMKEQKQVKVKKSKSAKKPIQPHYKVKNDANKKDTGE